METAEGLAAAVAGMQDDPGIILNFNLTKSNECLSRNVGRFCGGSGRDG